MSILKSYHAAFESGDVESLKNILHDNCEFIPHVGKSIFRKEDMLGIATMDFVKTESIRILYENDEVGVDHCIAHFANGSDSEAVLAFYQFEDGKIIRVETGATPLSENYNLVGN